MRARTGRPTKGGVARRGVAPRGSAPRAFPGRFEHGLAALDWPPAGPRKLRASRRGQRGREIRWRRPGGRLKWSVWMGCAERQPGVAARLKCGLGAAWGATWNPSLPWPRGGARPGAARAVASPRASQEDEVGLLAGGCVGGREQGAGRVGSGRVSGGAGGGGRGRDGARRLAARRGGSRLNVAGRTP